METQIGPGSFLELFATAGDIRISEIPSGRGRRFFVCLDEIASLKSEMPKSDANLSREHVLQNAALLMDGGELVLARTLYSFLLKHNVRDQEALKGLGVCLFRLGQTAAARKCLSAYLEIAKTPEAHYWMGLLAVAEKDDQLAIAALQLGLESSALSNAQRLEGYKELGSAFLRLGKLELAEPAYRKALSLNEKSDALRVNLGTLEHQRGQLDAAKDWFEEALTVNPASFRAVCGLGMIAVTEGDRRTAWAFFVRANEIEPKFWLAAQELVAIAETPAQVSFAKLRLKAILEKEPNHGDARYSLAALLFKEGAWTESQREVATTLRYAPGHQGANRLRELLVANRHLNS